MTCSSIPWPRFLFIFLFVGCTKSELPDFPLVFDGESDGIGYVNLRKLNSNRTAAALINIDLIMAGNNDQKRIQGEIDFYMKLREYGNVHHSLNIGYPNPPAAITAIKYDSPIGKQPWDQGNIGIKPLDEWTAISGNIDVILTYHRAPSSPNILRANVTLSNVVFVHNKTKMKTLLKQMLINTSVK